MQKLFACIVKDVKVLFRDKVGLTLMFVMPVILAIVITSLQNGTFELVNSNKTSLLIYNADTSSVSKEFIQSIKQSNAFTITESNDDVGEKKYLQQMQEKDALLAVIIPKKFSAQLKQKAKQISEKALSDFGLQQKINSAQEPLSYQIKLYFNPVLQPSYLQSVEGALNGALQLTESKELIKTLYASVNEKEMPLRPENDLTNKQAVILEIPATQNNIVDTPNATQHNIPAWTIFAMFFIITSLGGGIVREKQSGSFLRLKTMPGNFMLILASKQITYIGICLLQVVLIFSIGVCIFPIIGLPKLILHTNILALTSVSVLTAWCAVSFATCVGTFAKTQEQANGFGAISVILLAALGGILVPSFAMPHSFQLLLKLSPMHWALQAYYQLIIQSGLHSIQLSLFMLLAFSIFFRGLMLWQLKRKRLL